MSERDGYLSQVFLKDRFQVANLVDRSSIGRGDTVLEIGPGKGIITDELLKRASFVIAVEKDTNLYQQLLLKYRNSASIELYNMSILDFNLPNFDYKVFSNIPFSIEGQVVRGLIDNANPPLDTYLILRREVAQRLAGVPDDGLFSVLHKPWFNINIFYHFRRDDFNPRPKVESSMIRFNKRDVPLVEDRFANLYRLLISQGFEGGRRINQNLESAFSPSQFGYLASQLGFRVNNMPSELDFNQWIGIFNYFVTKVPESQIRSFLAKLRR